MVHIGAMKGRCRELRRWCTSSTLRKSPEFSEEHSVCLGAASPVEGLLRSG